MYQQVSTNSIYQLPREAKIVLSPCSGITQKKLVLGSRNQGNLSIAKLSHDLGILDIILRDSIDSHVGYKGALWTNQTGRGHSQCHVASG